MTLITGARVMTIDGPATYRTTLTDSADNAYGCTVVLDTDTLHRGSFYHLDEITPTDLPFLGIPGAYCERAAGVSLTCTCPIRGL